MIVVMAPKKKSVPNPACCNSFKNHGRVGTATRQRLQAMNVEVSDTSSDQAGESEIVQQLKDAYHASTKKSLKTQILTILPNSWTRQKMMEEFGATDCMVR